MVKLYLPSATSPHVWFVDSRSVVGQLSYSWSKWVAKSSGFGAIDSQCLAAFYGLPHANPEAPFLVANPKVVWINFTWLLITYPRFCFEGEIPLIRYQTYLKLTSINWKKVPKCVWALTQGLPADPMYPILVDLFLFWTYPRRFSIFTIDD